MTEFYYSGTITPFAEGKQFRNASLFRAAEPDATKVYVVGEHPEIVTAYEKAGVPVIRLDLTDPRLRSSAPISATAGPAERPAITDTQKSAVEIPSGWESMSWTDLRRLATSLSPKPVPRKAVALAIVKAELARRGAA